MNAITALDTSAPILVSAPGPPLLAARVEAAIHQLLATTDVDAHEVAVELEQARKREVGQYVRVLSEGVARLAGLVGAAADQVDQFKGSPDDVFYAKHKLTHSSRRLVAIADDLAPIS